MRKYLPRVLLKELQQSAAEYPVVAVLGPRQSGKTTLVQKAFPKKAYVSLEDLENRDFASQDPRGFLSSYKAGVIIDEAQRVPALLSYIQTEVDQNKKKGWCILTGSNQFLLDEKISQSLAGRVSILRLLPLSFEELKPQYKFQTIEDVIFKGGYPQLFVENLRENRWFNNYVETYVHKDIRLIKNISNLSQFNVFLKMCAARVGQTVNLQSLSNDCGLSQNTVKSWLSLLESSFIAKRIAPYYKNFNKRLVKSPKIFFYDTGLLCWLLSVRRASDITLHPLKGALFENWVFSELQKYFFNRGQPAPVYFWRNKTGYEVDFLIDNRVLKAIEVKASKTLSGSFLKNLIYFSQITGGKKIQPYLIYAGEQKQKRTHAQVLPFTDLHQIF